MQLVSRLQELYGLRPVPKAVACVAPTAAAPKQLKKGYAPGEVKLPKVDGDPPAFSLMGVLERYQHNLDTSQAEEVPVILGGERKQGRFHPSEICKDSACMRAMAYELFSAPFNFKVDAQLRRIFDNGHFVHARLQRALKHALATVGGQFYEEIGFRSKADRMSGTTDGGIVLNGWPYLLEIKSMNKSDFDALGAYPWDDHYDQVNIYMHYLGVRAAFVLIECKNNQKLREYFVRYDEARWRRVADVMDTVLGYVEQSQLPPVITEKQGCSEKCKFHSICKGAQKSKWQTPYWPDVADLTWQEKKAA